MVSALGYHGDSKNVIGKEHFVRQAAILFGMAKTTRAPKISAALLGKAADLKLQVDEPGARLTRSPSHRTSSEGTPAMVTAWLPTPEELAALNAGAAVRVRILGTQHPPIMLSVGGPPEST
jgi:hypothetical protein